MKHCFICKKDIHNSNYMGIFRLGKEGIIIPPGMREKEVLCKECYTKEKDQCNGSSLYVNPNVKGLTFYNKKLTAEDAKRIFEQTRRNGLKMIDENEPYFVQNLEERYPSIKIELQRILSPYAITEADYIGSSLKLVVEYDQAADYQERDRELDKLEFFLRNLKDIENYDKILFEKFRQKVVNALSKGDFFGIRLEVMTCSTLIRNQLNFDSISENPSNSTPDFAIHTRYDIFVECTTTHLEEKKEGDLTFKIRRTLRDKSSKPYANSTTALFIDATNIFYNSMVNSSELDGNLRDALNKMLEDTKFGSVLIFRYLFENRPERRLTHGYSRFDNKTIDSELLDFLNKNFPPGSYHIDKFFQPHHG